MKFGTGRDSLTPTVRSLLRVVTKGSAQSLLIKLGYMAAQFVTGVVLARSLGAPEFGVYSLGIAMVTVAVVPAQCGFTTYLTRMSATVTATGDLSSLKGVLLLASKSVSLVSLFITGVLLGYILNSKQFEVGSFTTTLVLAACLVPFLALTLVKGGAVRGLGYVASAALPEQIFRPFFLLLFLLVGAQGITTSAPTAMAANLAATVIAWFVADLTLRRALPRELSAVEPHTNAIAWMRGALPYLFLASAQVINHQVDIFMIATMLSTTEVGIYRVAIQVAETLFIVLSAIGVAMAPYLARYHAQGDWHAIHRLLAGAHAAGALLVLPVAALFVVYGPTIIVAIFGNDYSMAGTPLSVLAVGKLAYALVGFCGLALGMFGMPKAALVVTLATILANVALNSLWIPQYGMIGAAWATNVSAFGVNAVLALWLGISFRCNFTAFGAGVVLQKKKVSESE